MLKAQIILSKTCRRKRFYSLQASRDKLKNYQNTVFLPKTDFPAHLMSDEVVLRDKKIHQEAGFDEFYSWQRKNLKGEYILHDGPPYANGKPHLGHAINKILKDIILRSQVVQGKRVHYVPGWDCHGLPIELLVLNNEECLNTVTLRKKAKDVALNMSEIQKAAFREWGVMGDWLTNCYYTFDKSYVSNQLKIFWGLFEKGLIYYGLRPVFWSPSSKTALAGAELVYKKHISKSVFVRFQVNQSSYPEPLYLLIWSTTPWSLPLNKAVFVSPNINYSVVKISSQPGLYVIATELISDIKKKLKADIVKQSDISSKEIANLKYRHPWKKDELLDVFETENLKILGTGLLHCVPELGHEDYLLGLKNNLKLECFIDENGCYTSNAGKSLEGLDVLESGSAFVLKNLSSEIILLENYDHTYPYDWRTDKPVIIRASNQWFIDCSQLIERALERLKNVEVPLDFFKKQLEDRPNWCLSRQRKWGVPIPVFFHKTSHRPLISRSLVDHIRDLVELSGSDIWWTKDIKTLFPNKFCEEFFVKIEDVVKGEDIMDIWFDSGVSWSYIMKGRKSEVYVEGSDQYRGWFQSSLLTSVAIVDDAPYKKIITHGFAVDQEGRKMSKSLGNVLDPDIIVKGKNAFGVDTLRWWVAHHSSKSTIPVSVNLIETDFLSVLKLRKILRFLLGALRDTSLEDLENKELTHLDRYLLNSCSKFYHSLMSHYNVHDMYNVCCEILNFVTQKVSGHYINLIKDRLYCDRINSPRRKACLYTIDGILETLCNTLAPILPHLIEEVYMYHPLKEGEKFFYKTKIWRPPEFWNDDSADASIKLLNEIKEGMTKKGANFGQMCCVIQIDEENFKLLKKMQNDENESSDSELTEFLQVAEVQLKMGVRNISFLTKNSAVCSRCRRFTAPENEELCKRCFDLVS